MPSSIPWGCGSVPSREAERRKSADSLEKGSSTGLRLQLESKVGFLEAVPFGVPHRFWHESLAVTALETPIPHSGNNFPLWVSLAWIPSALPLFRTFAGVPLTHFLQPYKRWLTCVSSCERAPCAFKPSFIYGERDLYRLRLLLATADLASDLIPIYAFGNRGLSER